MLRPIRTQAVFFYIYIELRDSAATGADSAGGKINFTVYGGSFNASNI